LKFNRTPCPSRITANGEELTRYPAYEDLEKAREGWWFDPSGAVVVKITAEGKMIITLEL